MVSETAATVPVLRTDEAGPYKQPRTGETNRRESWIPYPILPDADEPAGIMDYAEFTRLCQEDVDALFNMVNETYASLEAANRQITTLAMTWKTRTGDLRTRSVSKKSKQTNSSTRETAYSERL
jgi:hypothetical protein